MEQPAGYSNAQKHIEEHQRQRKRLKLWIVLLLLAGLVMVLASQAGSHDWLCMLPIVLGLGAFVMDGIELYLNSPQRELSTTVFKKEMTWLFGDDWQTTTDTQEYMLGQERIRRRQVRRRQFYPHLFVSLVFNSSLYWMLYTPPNYGSPEALGVFAISLGLLIVHGYIVFPWRGRLERQERRFGQALQAEIAHVQPEVVKRKQQPKRDMYYRIGEDGELVEVRRNVEGDEGEKPKQNDVF